MSGDVQPRKRKDKRRKKEDGAAEDTPTPFVSDETFHVHKDGVTGGNILAKVIFFGLMGALVVVIGLIIVEYRGSSDVDMPLEESRFADLLHGWVDDAPPADDHGEPEESSEHDEHDDHDDEHSDEGGGDHEEEEHDGASTEHEDEEEAEESQELSEEEEQEEEEEDLPEESLEGEEEEEEESEEMEGIPGVTDSDEQGLSEEEEEEESEEQGGSQEAEAKRKGSQDKTTPLVPKVSRSTTEPQPGKENVRQDFKQPDTVQKSSATRERADGVGETTAMPPAKVAGGTQKSPVDALHVVPKSAPTPTMAPEASGKHSREAQPPRMESMPPTPETPAKTKPLKVQPTVEPEPAKQAPSIQPTAKPAPVTEAPPDRPVVMFTPQLAPVTEAPPIQPKPAPPKQAPPIQPTLKPAPVTQAPVTQAPVTQAPPIQHKPAPPMPAPPGRPVVAPITEAPPSESKPTPVKQPSPTEPMVKPAPDNRASPVSTPAPVRQASTAEPTTKPIPVIQAPPPDKPTVKPTPQPMPIRKAAPVGEPVNATPTTESPNNRKQNAAQSKPSEPRVQDEKQNIEKLPPSPSSHKDEDGDDAGEEEDILEDEEEELEEEEGEVEEGEEDEEEEEEPEPSGAKQQDSTPEESEGEEESDEEQPPVTTPAGKPKSSGAQEQQEEAAQEPPRTAQPEETDQEPGKCAQEQVDVMEEEAEPHLELDEAELILQNSPIDALRVFMTVVEKHPNSVRVRYGKARCLDRMADMRQSNSLLGHAIDAYLSVLELELRVPDDTYIAIAKRCIDRMRFMGHHMKAVAVHQDLIQRFPDSADHRNQLAITYLLKNRISESREVLLETLQRWPQDGLALVHLGFILKTTDNNLLGAIDHLQRGIDSEAPGTNDGRFHFQLGDALMRLGRGDEALQVYELGVQSGLFRSKYQRSLYNVDRLKAQPWWTPQETTYSRHFKKLTDNWRVIRDEGLAALTARIKDLFKDEAESLRESGDWKQLELFARGRKVSGSCDLTPVTCRLIDEFPAAKGCRRGQVKFSVIEPGTHVWPHCGPTNCRLRAHLGLQVPTHTYIRVANITRSWKEGELLVFDDSFEHEVWHNGTDTRLVLIVDVWHPELTEQERKSLPAI